MFLSALYRLLASSSHPRTESSFGSLFEALQMISTEIYGDVFNYTQYFDEKRLGQIQKKRLAKIIDYSKNNIPFYKEYLESLKSMDGFSSLTPISKHDVRKAVAEGTIINPKLRRFGMHRYTSGSTGIPLHFFRDANGTARRRAIYRRIMNWVGKKRGDLTVQINGRIRQDLISEVKFFLCDGPQELKNRKGELYDLLRSNTIVLFGMPSNLIRLAQCLEKDNIKIQFRAIISDSEALYSEVRSYLTKVFKAPVFDSYGCEEVAAIAQECEFHNGLHVNSEWVYVEIINENNQHLPPGEKGDIVLTSFDNEIMPFIKYKNGDKGYWLEGPCPCGRTLPRLKIEGRALYSFELPDGRIGDVFRLTRSIAYLASKILQYQIIRQEKNRFVIRLIAFPSFSDDDKNFILSKVAEYLGREVLVSLELVDKIETEKGAKPKGFINLCRD